MLVNGIEHDDYFVQKLAVDATYIDANRLEFFVPLVSGKKVLHVGFVDYPITNPAHNLHLSLAPHCARMDGFDVNEQHFDVLTVPNGTNYSVWDSVPDDYDVILIPEVIEHVGNLEEFLQRITQKQGTVVITAPDSTLLNNRLQDMGSYVVEVVHPDHNCVYTPYTLMNTIHKYSHKRVERLFWISRHSIAAICK